MTGGGGVDGRNVHATRITVRKRLRREGVIGTVGLVGETGVVCVGMRELLHGERTTQLYRTPATMTELIVRTGIKRRNEEKSVQETWLEGGWVAVNWNVHGGSEIEKHQPVYLNARKAKNKKRR